MRSCMPCFCVCVCSREENSVKQEAQEGFYIGGISCLLDVYHCISTVKGRRREGKKEEEGKFAPCALKAFGDRSQA